jgi:hydrogenase expression/formation protein HypC
MCLAIPGRITEVFRENDVLMGRIDFGGVRKQICLEYLPDIAVGDYALVHVGFAIARVDEKHAAQVFAMLDQIDIDELRRGGAS